MSRAAPPPDPLAFLAPEGLGSTCCTNSGGLGCDDTTCQELICSNFDSACCSVAWDQGCADAANSSCGICGGSLCGGSTQNCCQADNSPNPPFETGCNNAACCGLVCEVDSYCCVGQWDMQCKNEAKALCSTCWQAPPGDCCTEHTAAGCNVESCAQAVCANNPLCCGDMGGGIWDADCGGGGCWDSFCVAEALDVCAPSACPRTLTVTKAGTGTGAITDTVPGSTINCSGAGPDCSQTYGYGASVTLSETPSGGSAFAAWSGGTCTGSASTCSFTMTANRTVTGTFNPPPSQTLTITKAGTGTGAITATGINCPGDCSESYAFGTMVTLNATATSPSTFAGWSGDGTCTGSTSPCGPFAMDQARAVTGTFDPPPDQTLNVTIAGGGTGTVSDGAEGDIACSTGQTGTCTDTYAFDTVVTLTAVPDGGSVFESWSGEAAACGITNPCNVTLSEQRDVTATFSFILFVDGFETVDGMCAWTEAVGGDSCPP